MKKRICLLFCMGFWLAAPAQTIYTLTYTDSTARVVMVTLQPTSPVKGGTAFVMPRSIPGSYSISLYDQFVEDVNAFTPDGKKIPMQEDGNDAPRWYCTDSSRLIHHISYRVNLEKMENRISLADASIIRPGFAGILNYSVFGWMDGKEKEPVICSVTSFPGWSIFSSNEPSLNPAKEKFSFETDNYYTLADGQLFIGTRFKVKSYQGITPLYIAAYCETGEEYLDDYGKQGTSAMGILQAYFGELPFQQYSILLRKALPLDQKVAPSLAMEHLQSSTFFGDTSGMRKVPMSPERITATIPTIIHHMAHSLLPLRCYGDNYRPHVLEIPPIINNIWFNEGFMWFLPYDTLKLERMKKRFIDNVYNTAIQIKQLSLQELSQLASTMYGTDFRIGSSLYSRGALMALEMNEYLLQQSRGTRSMKDVFRYLYQWSKQNKRPFTLQELPQLLNQSCHIDLGKIYAKWQLPIQ
jgi:predicted metalloprotease with PDZ domain